MQNNPATALPLVGTTINSDVATNTIWFKAL